MVEKVVEKVAKVPEEVAAACEHLSRNAACEHGEIDPGQLLDFAVYVDRVVVVIATGQKYTVSAAALAERLKAGLKAVKEKVGGGRMKDEG
jgi:hypothetical protein